jgi:hypothetical protein
LAKVDRHIIVKYRMILTIIVTQKIKKIFLKIGINSISSFKASSTIKPRNTYSTGRLGAVDLLVLTSFRQGNQIQRKLI